MLSKQRNYIGLMSVSCMVYPAVYIVIEGHSSVINFGEHHGIVLALV